ncbi:MAG: DUF456 domain-containing protein [Syntrophaceticus sp.]|nr:DUF456 domain-containing protein [Syntrophaceticus sp.]MDD3313979.1 DUF456 domain-containing protein [Syntrophaceticus sp.]MDD4359056.1 DUF456 domain-containing protein [Syntrophaceticus sp.]MDD4783119.1 DUF456 domain-containing protein [Syntrophaceticus sp.]
MSGIGVIDIITIILLGICVLLALIPFMPGTPIIFGIMLIYAFIDGFQQITLPFLAIMLVITIFSTFIDNIVSWLGAKRYGGSRAGLWGAFLGGIIGVLINPLLGILSGPFMGAIVAELVVSHRQFNDAVKVGVGTIIGVFGGAILKLIISLFMVVAFVMQIY